MFCSRNQLTVIPPFIKCLQALEVFLASHNKLVSLPEEIGELKRLMEIVSIGEGGFVCVNKSNFLQ